jgi:hypothetical protein
LEELQLQICSVKIIKLRLSNLNYKRQTHPCLVVPRNSHRQVEDYLELQHKNQLLQVDSLEVQVEVEILEVYSVEELNLKLLLIMQDGFSAVVQTLKPEVCLVEIIKPLLNLLAVAYLEVITNKPVLQRQVVYSEEDSNKIFRAEVSSAANKIKLLHLVEGSLGEQEEVYKEGD